MKNRQAGKFVMASLAIIFAGFLLALFPQIIPKFLHADSTSYALGSGQAGYISCTQATPCASSATTFLVAPATTLYRVNASVACTGTAAAATAILTIKYTDPSSTVQTITLTTATCTALGSLSIAGLDQGIIISTGTNVQYSVTTVNSPAFQARVAVYQEGMN
jgi:hypothetical protein